MLKGLDEVGRRDCKADVREDAFALAFCAWECLCPVLNRNGGIRFWAGKE